MTNQKKNQNKNNRNPLRFYAAYSSLGIQMVVIILAGAFGGRELDKVVSWEFPVFTVGLTILCVVAAVIYGTRELFKKNDDK